MRRFTLVELLVVIAIIALLMSILLPALAKSKSMASDLCCVSNLKQVGMALTQYVDDNNGYGPEYNKTFQGVPFVRWQGWIIDYVYPGAFDAGRGGAARWWGQVPHIDDDGAIRSKAIFGCPSSPRQPAAGLTMQQTSASKNYGINLPLARDADPFHFNWCVRKVTIPSMVMYVTDIDAVLHADFIMYTEPEWGLRHRGGKGVNALYVDGHVQPRLRADLPTTNSDRFWGYKIGL